MELRYPDKTSRGVAFTLERARENDWVLEYFLTSGVEGYGDGKPHWVPWDTDDYGWDDIGVGGPGPDLIAIPPTAQPGKYRICTANAVENFCSELNIAADSSATTEHPGSGDTPRSFSFHVDDEPIYFD